MPRKYRRRRVTRKRYFKRSRSATIKGKRKASKGQRQSEQFAIPLDFEEELGVSNVEITKFYNCFELLLKAPQFVSMRDSYDQFRLDSIRFSLVEQCPLATNAIPYTLSWCIDRNGIPRPQGGDSISLGDMSSYGSYRYSSSNASNKAFLRCTITATTIQEKGQYLPTDVAGVADVNTVSLDPQVIPRYRSLYFPFNPVLLVGTKAVTVGANNVSGILRGRVTFYVTFRGLRTLTRGVDDRNGVRAFRGQGETDIAYDPSQVYQIPVKKPVINYPTFTTKASANYLNEFLYSLNDLSLSVDHPPFNSIPDVIYGLASSAYSLYQSFVQNVINSCASTFVSSLSDLGLYALARIVSVGLSNNDNTFLASAPGSTYFFLEQMATSGIPQGESSTAVTATDYCRTFRFGAHLVNFFKSVAINLFANDSSLYNDLCSFGLSYGVIGPNIGLLKALVNQNSTGAVTLNWTQVAYNATSSITIGPGRIIIVQFPHANYWVTGLLFNKFYTGSATSDEVINYPFIFNDFATTQCADSYPLFNTSVSNYFYVTSLSTVDFISTSAGLTLSVSPISVRSGAPAIEGYIYNETIPIGLDAIGYGVVGRTGPWESASDFGPFYPLFFSKNRLFGNFS